MERTVSREGLSINCRTILMSLTCTLVQLSPTEESVLAAVPPLNQSVLSLARPHTPPPPTATCLMVLSPSLLQPLSSGLSVRNLDDS